LRKWDALGAPEIRCQSEVWILMQNTAIGRDHPPTLVH
jgi:hypothetical protein